MGLERIISVPVSSSSFSLHVTLHSIFLHWKLKLFQAKLAPSSSFRRQSQTSMLFTTLQTSMTSVSLLNWCPISGEEIFAPFQQSALCPLTFRSTRMKCTLEGEQQGWKSLKLVCTGSQHLDGYSTFTQNINNFA